MTERDELIKRLSASSGNELLLRLLAEECTELAQAALKYIRVERRETPMGRMTVQEKLCEEIADVLNLIGCVRDAIQPEVFPGDIERMRRTKMRRWERRIFGGDKDGEQ